MIRKLMPYVVFDPNDVPAATPPAPAPVAAAPAAPPAPVAPPQPAPVGDGPWSADLAALFPDEAVRGQVDQFLRSKVQPHVTHIETEYAPARELWQDLQADDQSQSLGTYIAVAEQLYGEEVAQAVAQSLQAQLTAATPPAPAAPAAPQAVLTPEQQSAIDFASAQQAEQLYQQELDRVKVTAGDTAINEKIFARYVVSAEGDFDQALAAYLDEQVPAAPAAPEPPPPPPPPQTLNAEGAPATPPPTIAPRQTLDEALDETMAEMRAGAPATVGQV